MSQPQADQRGRWVECFVATIIMQTGRYQSYGLLEKRCSLEQHGSSLEVCPGAMS